jgi:gluconate 2-dehydrogenase gamma chain
MLITDFAAPACNKQKVEASLKLNRRAFLQAALVAAAGAGVACTANGTPWRFLTVDEARTLAAISDQIIPPDQDSGAAWAGVVIYIDRQLCGPFQNLQQTYRQGIAAIDGSSRLIYDKMFTDLNAQQQIDVLHRLENGQVSSAIWMQFSSSEFFSLVIDHTMQGYYGDPRHGGNREGVSWKMLGLPYPPIRGRLKYDLTKPAGSEVRTKGDARS